MSEKMRVTMHNGRTRANGEVYSAKHNDRNYDTKNAANINPEPEHKNRYFIVNPVTGEIDNNPSITFEEHEKNVYEFLFSDALEAQNERYRKKGNYDRIKTTEDLRLSARTAVEETILQLGCRGNHPDGVVLKRAVSDWLAEMQVRFGTHWKLLDGAIHRDESIDHCHIRAVWCAEGSDGLSISQTKGLKALGIERPDITKPESRHNNAKMNFTQIQREIWIACAERHGIFVETVPETPGKKTIALEQYVAQQKKAEVEGLTIKAENLITECQQLEEEVGELRKERSRLQKITRALKGAMERAFQTFSSWLSGKERKVAEALYSDIAKALAQSNVSIEENSI